MIAPPRLGSDALAELLRFVGHEQARKLCGVSERTVRRWKEGKQAVPLACLHVLWFASPWGRDAWDADVSYTLQTQQQQIVLYAAELARRLPLSIVPARFADADNDAFFIVPAAPAYTPRHAAPKPTWKRDRA